MEDRLYQIENKLWKRQVGGKIVNMILCIAIAILGISAFVYKASYEGGVLTCFREMTCCGTMYCSLAAIAYFFVNLMEVIKKKELTNRIVYYLRLSSAVTEFIIILIVLVGYLPIFPDHPVIARYDMLNMHLLVPILTMYSFFINDAPVGKLKPKERCNGLIFLIMYSVVIITLIITGVIPENKIPYSFLNVLNQPLWFTLFAVVVIFGFGYLLSWFFSWINRKVYWLKYKNIAR